MTNLLAKASNAPTIENVRTICAGTQYTIADPDFYHTVTVNSERITCTCVVSTCAHIQVVQNQRARNLEVDAHRAVYCELFDLSYGD